MPSEEFTIDPATVDELVLETDEFAVNVPVEDDSDEKVRGTGSTFDAAFQDAMERLEARREELGYGDE